MLISPRLDDQSFDEIVAEAKGRLPWLCPVWTDHNAHDPGITILELMAWYKEMQQYQMDQMTPAIQRKLLALTGVEPLGGENARCGLEFPPEAKPRRVLERLTTPQGVSFELLEAVPRSRPVLEQAFIEREDTRVDVTVLTRNELGFPPFSFGGRESALSLGFRLRAAGELRLWFELERPAGVPRNPPDEHTPPPRSLTWELAGAGAVTPALDETWALSWSGYVVLPVPGEWRADEAGLHWLTLRLARAGCEEQPRVARISTGRFRAAQRESRALRRFFRISPAPNQEILLETAQARRARLAVFLWDGGGWRELSEFRREQTGQGLLLSVDGSGAAAREQGNLLVVCQRLEDCRQLQWDATGRPGEELYLNTDGRRVLPGRLELLCRTLCQDGEIRPALWRRVEDLAVCGPRERVFAFDAGREMIVFGDGLHGALPAPGPVLATELVLSLCGGGNVPAGAGLTFRDGETIANQAASGGRDPESLTEARGRLLAALSGTKKCLSAGDYAARAKETPGLRVAGAKAIPGYDARTPNLRRQAMVTVAVFPAGEGDYPVADERFLEAVSRQLERCRTVCIQTRVVPLRYVPVSLTARLRLSPGSDLEEIRRALRAWFLPREERIGEPLRQNEVGSFLQKRPGVLQVLSLTLRGLDQNCYRTAAGDLELPPDAAVKLEALDLGR